MDAIYATKTLSPAMQEIKDTHIASFKSLEGKGFGAKSVEVQTLISQTARKLFKLKLYENQYLTSNIDSIINSHGIPIKIFDYVGLCEEVQKVALLTRCFNHPIFDIRPKADCTTKAKEQAIKEETPTLDFQHSSISRIRKYIENRQSSTTRATALEFFDAGASCCCILPTREYKSVIIINDSKIVEYTARNVEELVLANLPKLRQLDRRNTYFTKRIFLANLPKLTQLSFVGSKITSLSLHSLNAKVIIHFVFFPNIEDVSIMDCRNTTVYTGKTALLRLEKLKLVNIFLFYPHVDINLEAPLSKITPNLETLYLSNISDSNNRHTITQIANHSKITSIYIKGVVSKGCYVSPTSITNCPNLQDLLIENLETTGVRVEGNEKLTSKNILLKDIRCFSKDKANAKTFITIPDKDGNVIGKLPE